MREQIILVQNSINEKAEHLINTMNRHDNYMANLLLLRDENRITLKYPVSVVICGLILQGVVIVFYRHPATFFDILDSSTVLLNAETDSA